MAKVVKNDTRIMLLVSKVLKVNLVRTAHLHDTASISDVIRILLTLLKDNHIVKDLVNVELGKLLTKRVTDRATTVKKAARLKKRATRRIVKK